MAILEVNRRKQWFRANWKKKRKKQGTHTCNMAQKKLKQKQCAHEFVRRGLGFSLGLILPVFFRNTSKADKKKRSWELRRPIGERKSKNSKRRSPKTRTTTKRNHAAVPNETIIKIIAIKKEKKTRATQKVKIEDGEGIGRTRKKNDVAINDVTLVAWYENGARTGNNGCMQYLQRGKKKTRVMRRRNHREKQKQSRKKKEKK